MVSNGHFIALECDLGCLLIPIAVPELQLQSPCLSGYKGHEMILQVLLDWRSLRFQCLGCPTSSTEKSAFEMLSRTAGYEISIMVLKLLRKICSAFSPVRNRANLLKNIIHSDSQGRMSASGSYF